MTARTLQPSEYEIQREVEALRDIRRRSSNPGALSIDLDLPNQSPPSSPTTSYWSNPALTSSYLPSSSPNDGDSSSSSHEDGSSSDRSSNDAGTSHTTVDNTVSNNPTDDPFHLFWVPASLHPEIAPAEFRAFLKEHAKSPPAEGSPGLQRSGSAASSLSISSSLSRKRSMLSRQYKPTEGDGVEDEKDIVPLRRNRTSMFANRGPQLTISDLQKLEELAEDNVDPSRLRNVLRRSLSLNVSPSVIDQMDDMPDMGDEADAPIIVPPPGLILRRTARTKIRKPGLPGDGNGHRFGATRRGAPVRTQTAPVEPRSSSDLSSSDHDHGDAETALPPQQQQQHNRAFSNESFAHIGGARPESLSEEAIIDSYYDVEEEVIPAPIVVTTPPPLMPDEVPLPASPPLSQVQQPEIQPSLLEALGPVLHQPQPQRLLSPTQVESPQQLSRTPSPSSESILSTDSASTPAKQQPLQQQSQAAYSPTSTPSFLSTSPPPLTANHRKEKDKKGGLFGKWGSDKAGKKSKDRENRERSNASASEKEKETTKEPSFFGSLFGGKKKQDQDYASNSAGGGGAALGGGGGLATGVGGGIGGGGGGGLQGGHSGRETAQALLGASKSSKSYLSPTGSPQPGLANAIGPNSYARYPIHVERAIYRLSHIKLANPRRPLYEQVLISNLMFWYLGVINKAQNPTPPSPQGNGQSAAGTNGAGTGAGQQPQQQQGQGQQPQQQQPQQQQSENEQREKERWEKEQQERAEKERAERERTERERAEREQKEREAEVKKKESGRRGSLTKTPAAGSPGGGRRAAEMPVKGPQYEMQHRVMEQEYNGYANSNGQPPQGVPLGRSVSANGVGQSSYSRTPNSAPQLTQPSTVQPLDFYFSVDDDTQQPQQSSLQTQSRPPGAMAPAEMNTWLNQSSPPSSRKRTSPPPNGAHRRSRSPPPPLPNQSLSNSSRHRANASAENLVLGSGGAKLGGRSLSATASPPVQQTQGKTRKGQSAHAVVPQPKRPRTSDGRQDGYHSQQHHVQPNEEEEDVPLSVWQQQRRR